MQIEVIVIETACSCQDFSRHIRTVKDFASVVIHVSCYVHYMLKNALEVVKNV